MLANRSHFLMKRIIVASYTLQSILREYTVRTVINFNASVFRRRKVWFKTLSLSHGSFFTVLFSILGSTETSVPH